MPELASRDDALALLHEYTQSDSLRRHALGVEAAMRAYARQLGEDEHRWGLVGLLHDFDYERWPTREEHPWKGSEILAGRGYPDDVRGAIMAHALYTGVPRDTRMARAIVACDELTGFLVACALVQPGKSLSAVKVDSVKKKLKKKEFARSVSREEIDLGAREFAADTGFDFDRHVEFVLGALLPLAADLGLGA